MFSKLCCILFVFGGNGFDLLLCIVCEVIEGRFIHTRAVLVISRLFFGHRSIHPWSELYWISTHFPKYLLSTYYSGVCLLMSVGSTFILWNIWEVLLFDLLPIFHVEFLVSVSSHKIHFVLLPLCPLTFSYLFFFNLNDFYLNVNVITRFALQDTNLMLPTCRWCFQN